MPDSKLEQLVMDSVHNGSQVEVLPMDTLSCNIRYGAHIFCLYCVTLFVAVEADLIQCFTGGRQTLRQMIITFVL